MDLISELGPLAFGSRLKRLSDMVMKGGQEVYRHYGVDFEPKWFTLFYFLVQREEAGIMEIAENLKVTHPAIIQTAKELEKKGLITSKKCAEDARKRNLQISKKGKELLPTLQKIWEEIRLMNKEIIDKQEHNLLSAIKEMEDTWLEKSYLQRFIEFHGTTAK
ncbi:DNA-binding transcriptional regulator, MarR family [Pseudarcicella hirudinis]|uniref:DNA-binding transcriptional regulator, MarR family n=2 Tax=Pseudarcicella hirudinis TaxID=1079859 RepID=A0A1I5NQT7_9BACT|nr:MarR family transcriptional regulator [Pseudarcicella hirudinis]SFP24102.1 DNA-binding transcriptional regulator, MarR family [Pseudarcicella hirudinis]